MDKKNKLDILFNKYNLSLKDKDYLFDLINPIFSHLEFQKRLTNDFLHHSDITLGEHILEDTIVTYLLSKKYLNKNKNDDYSINLAVKIAMLHDLYTIPWQNNKEAKVKHFFNKHGFRHSIEATINAINWYPDIFKNKEEAKIIIDGIIHHMFPLPVRVFNYQNVSKIELKNFDKYNKLTSDYKEMIISSLKRGKVGILSFAKSKYKEGRIMSKADRIVSRKQIKNLESFKALFTGNNKSLTK